MRMQKVKLIRKKPKIMYTNFATEINVKKKILKSNQSKEKIVLKFVSWKVYVKVMGLFDLI